MTHDQHRQRHVQLHEHLDELVADWIAQTNALPGETPVMELARWSRQQMLNPTPNRFQRPEEAHMPVIEVHKR